MNISVETVKRLPIYLDYCKSILETEPETKYISSTRIAEELFLKEQAVVKCLLGQYYFKEGKQYQLFEDKQKKN